MKRRKSRVPDAFQSDAIFPFSAFLASRKITNLTAHEYFDSPASTVHIDYPSMIKEKEEGASAKFLRAPGSGGLPRGVQNFHSLHIQSRRNRIFDRLVIADVTDEVGDRIAGSTWKRVQRDRLSIQRSTGSTLMCGADE